MVVRHHVEGYEAFKEFMKKFKPEEVVHIYFGGSKLPSGESWCTDCVEAWPTIEAALNDAPENSHFVYVEVGDRPFWKDHKCPFKQDSTMKIQVLPTLVRWKGVQKLQGEQCGKAELVKMLFQDDEN